MSRYEGPRTPLGERIRAAREAKGLTQEQLADALQTRRHVIIRWETGEHAPQKRYRAKLAELLGGTADDYKGDAGQRASREADEKKLEQRVDEIRADKLATEAA